MHWHYSTFYCQNFRASHEWITLLRVMIFFYLFFVFYENFCSSNFYNFFFNGWKFTHSELSQKKQVSSKNRTLISVHKFTEWLWQKHGLLKKALYLRNLWINHPNFMHWYFHWYLSARFIYKKFNSNHRENLENNI